MFDLSAAEIYYWARRYDKTIELVSPAAGASSYHGFLLGWAYAGEGK